MSRSWLAMNAERAQKGAQPYECRPTPSMLTPNQERLVTTLPKEGAAVPNGDGHHVGGQPEVRVDFLLPGARDLAPKRGPGPATNTGSLSPRGSGVALSREESERVGHPRSVVLPVEDQRLDDALAGQEDTVEQEVAEIGIAATGEAAGVLHLDLIGETPDDREEVRVHDRRAVVRDPVHVLLPVTANAVGLDQRDLHLPGDLQELETHVPAGKGVVVRRRKEAGHPSVHGAEGREVRTVFRVREIPLGDHERLRR